MNYRGNTPETVKGSAYVYSINGETGLEVPNKNVIAYANAIKELAENEQERKAFGNNAHTRVVENFLFGQFKESLTRVMAEQ